MNLNVFKTAFPGSLIVMVTFLSTILLASADSSFAAAASKKSPPAVHKSAVDLTESRIKNLQGALKITEEQQAAWDNMTLVMRENAKDMDAISKERSETAKKMNSVDRMKFHSKITEAYLAQQQKMIPVFETLYLSMSDDQKKTTDEIFTTGKHRKSRSTK